MPFIVKTESGQQIKLEDKPFTSGGEGELYKIVSPQSLCNYCVKIYYSQFQTQQKERKLRFMINHKPKQISDGTNYMICWVVDLVFRQDIFVGFLMPLAFDNSIQLYELCTKNIKKNLASIWNKKYNRNHDKSIENRLKLCVNIAIAIHNIHNAKNYVLVDMKPQNILLSPEGKISIVDLDSLQISKGSNVIYRGHVATPEYTPAEGKILNPSNNLIPESWDRFSLAIIFYELIFGIHPFVATSTGKYENITTIDEAIKNGLFVFGSKSKYLQLPSPHNNFQLLPKSIKELFIKALDRGHNNPSERPSAEDWGQVLFNELQLETVKVNIDCPLCTQAMRVPLYKHIKAKCNNCSCKIEVKNGNIVGYVSEKVVTVEKKVFEDKIVTVEKHNPFFIIVSILLVFGMFWGYYYFDSQLSVSRNSITKIQSLQNDNQKLNKIISKLSLNMPFVIDSIDFKVTNNSTQDDLYSSQFVYSTIKYVYPRVKILPLISKKVVTVSVKFISPSGLVKRNSFISPDGYTYKSDENIYSETDYLYLDGWGSESVKIFEIGTHRVEIWCNDMLIGSGIFEVTL